MMTENQDRVPTIDDLSAYLKISRTFPYKLPRKKEIPGQKIGKNRLFRKEIIDQWLGDSRQSTQRK